jgi:hypothetical protein
MIWITIRRSTLVKLHACKDGLALYDAIVAHQENKKRIRFAYFFCAACRSAVQAEFDSYRRGTLAEYFGFYERRTGDEQI